MRRASCLLLFHQCLVQNCFISHFSVCACMDCSGVSISLGCIEGDCLFIQLLAILMTSFVNVLCFFRGEGSAFNRWSIPGIIFLIDIGAANIFYSVTPFISSALSSDKAFIFILISVYCPHRSWASSPFLLKNTLVLTT